MKNHSAYWYIAFVSVLIAIAITLLRKTAEAPAVSVLTDSILSSFLAQVDKDPQLRRLETRLLVYRVADASGNDVFLPEVDYARGLKLKYEGKFLEARDVLQRAIKNRPDWAPPYNALGVVLYRLGELDKAEETLKKAISLSPKWSRPHNDLAILLRLENRLEEALEHAQIAVDLNPDDIATHNNFGNLLVAMGKYDEAAVYYRKAMELDPKHPAPYYNLACVASLQGRYDKALDFLGNAISRDEGFLREALRDPHLEKLREQDSFAEFIFSKSKSNRSESITEQPSSPS